MTITSAICNSFKQEILIEGHNFMILMETDQFKIALYSSNSATLSKSTTAYTAPTDATARSNKHLRSNNNFIWIYTAGGNNLTSTTPVLSGDTACCKFANTVMDISFFYSKRMFNL